MARINITVYPVSFYMAGDIKMSQIAIMHPKARLQKECKNIKECEAFFASVKDEYIGYNENFSLNMSVHNGDRQPNGFKTIRTRCEWDAADKA